MPKKAGSACEWPGCPVIHYNGKYCDEHMAERKSTYAKTYKKKESRKHLLDFYNSRAWKGLRQHHITRNPLCKSCELEGLIVPADHVDHIIEIRDDWDKRLDSNNLQSLCISCHSKKTLKERKKRQ